MIPLHFEKIYSTEARWEPCRAALPLPQGTLKDAGAARVFDERGEAVPTQARATALWPDGSVKWLLVRFMARVPALRAVDYALDFSGAPSSFAPFAADARGADTGALSFRLSEGGGALFESIRFGEREFGPECVGAPELSDEGGDYAFRMDGWTLAEAGKVLAIYRGEGRFTRGAHSLRCELTAVCFRGLPQIELRVRLVNTDEAPLAVRRFALRHRADYAPDARYAVGVSNYKTRWTVAEGGAAAEAAIDGPYLLYDANEHNAEVFYGTFLADCQDARGGVAATIYQAHQNFPKALRAAADGIEALLVPDGGVTLQSGMAREQRVRFDFHGPDTSLEALSDASTRWQMPNVPRVPPEVFEQSGALERVFASPKDAEMEAFLQRQADAHARCYGMLNWGDAPDMGYTQQGRGGGELVWTNNEYDFPHACALMYARTGVRRFLDYLLVSARHWLDVDICHYSDDPLLLGGQWEHTNGHCKNGRVLCSHQWVEGLLDYYHFTGDEDALRAAIGIGRVDLRLLETPEFKTPGETNAREAGWAMRALVALYRETNDEAWLAPCDFIVSHFEAWEAAYGHWLSPYMDNVRIRVVFMISVAVASLMRYYRVRPQEKLRAMILRAVNDLLENARLENGLFYYKELPSLMRDGNNPIVLEALACAYELTGDAAYLRAGLPTLRYVVAQNGGTSVGGPKRLVGDAVLSGSRGTKAFAQMLLPVASYYAACAREGLLSGERA